MDQPIAHDIEKKKAARKAIADRIQTLEQEAMSDHTLTESERMGIERVKRKLTQIDQKIAELEKQKDAGTGTPDATQGREVSFSEGIFWTNYRQSLINWLNDARDAINVISDVSGMDPKKATVELDDALAVLFLFDRFQDVKAAYEILKTLKDAYEKAIRAAAAAGGDVTIIDIRLKWRESAESVKSELSQKSYDEFVEGYKKKHNITEDKVNQAVFLTECVHFASRTMPDPKELEKGFAKNMVETLTDQDWGEEAEMNREDGKQAGYIILEVTGEAKYIGGKKEHEAVTWKGVKGSIDEASDGIKAAVGEAYKNTAVIDMPFRIALKLHVIYTNGMGASRRAEYFRASETPGSTSFAVRSDEVANTVGAPPRSKDSPESMVLLRELLSSGTLDPIKGTKVYK